ncbi:hypothetical protein PspLS_12051 [Pyricularia sp. CBS 133598]|nr:hypothetical protein PspLS_12051 [Pyricularia sp. CBS 133598]
MQFSKIQLFALMAVGAMANTVAPADVAAVDAPRAPLLVRRNCEGKNTQAECERFKWLTGCTWLRGSKYCSST